MGNNNREKIEIYKGVVVRKVNVIRFQVGAIKYKELLDEVEKTGLSLPKLISISGKPCEKCRGVNVVIYNSKYERVEIKRGLLSDYTIMNNGTTIINKNIKIKK